MEDIDWTPDKGASISSATGRLIVDGERAAEVRPEASSKTQIAALMDLLDLHLSQVDVGQSVDPRRVTLRVASLTSEARGALGTLIVALVEAVQVRVLEAGQNAEWSPARVGWNQADLTEYTGWPDLLARPRAVPALVSAIVDAAGSPALRAYPMLSTISGWISHGSTKATSGDSTRAERPVRGHEKVPTGGQVEVPAFGQAEVPTLRSR